MAISVDVLATAIHEQLPGLWETFLTWHPMWHKMGPKGSVKTDTLKGPYREFSVLTGGPGQLNEIATGNEIINAQRAQEGKRGNEYGTRIIYAFNVPLKDLDEANGPNDLADILETYPENGLQDFYQQMNQQMCVGGVSGAGGWFTFNGDATYNPEGVGARAGLIEFAAEASQNSSVHNLSSSTVTGWQNRYETISAFATDGRKQMLKTFYACQRSGTKVMGPVDCGFADEGSYLHYINDLDDQVRIVAETTANGDRAPSEVRAGIKFQTATLWLEDAIDVSSSQFSTSEAQNGVIYWINSSAMRMFFLGHGEGGAKVFSKRAPFRVPDQEAMRFEFVVHGNGHTISRRHLGATTGGAQ